MKTPRIPQAPSTPLSELAEFLAPFRVHFRRSEGPQSLERYLALTCDRESEALLVDHEAPGVTIIPKARRGDRRAQGQLYPAREGLLRPRRRRVDPHLPR